MGNGRDKKIKPTGEYCTPNDKAINNNMEKPILEGGGQPLQDETNMTHH
jgi:hypothetical protein